MNEQKYIDVARKLITGSQALTFTVISNSMSPLIKKDDRIVCSKTECGKIKKYDLIAFNDKSPDLKIPVVHRVVKILRSNDKFSFKTKGDNALLIDKETVEESRIIGKVDEIIKKNRRISLDKITHRYAGIFIFFALLFKNFIKLSFIKLINVLRTVFAKENKCGRDEDMSVLRQSVLTRIKDWHKLVETDVWLLNPFVSENKKICDISFGGGYCEESFNFTRRGFKVDYKKAGEAGGEDRYDIIICSRVLNIVDTYGKRTEIYDFIKRCAKEKGIILLSYINEKNNFFVRLKRSLYKFLYKKYDGPDKDDIIYKNFFIQKELPARQIIKELKNNGFLICRQKKYGRIVSFLLNVG